jgi:hypothetical protein
MNDNDNTVKFFHIKHPVERSVVTVAAKLEKNRIDFGFSFCSPNDNFCKKTGRVKSLGRAMAKNPVLCHLKASTTFSGKSSEDLCKVWNSEEVQKPKIWKHTKLVKTELGFGVLTQNQ